MKKQHIFGICSVSILLLFATSGVVGCAGNNHVYGSSTTPLLPAPSIQNINSETTPTNPVGFPIEINGSGFQAIPGKVNFTQGIVSMDVVPASSSWSETGVVAVVPSMA